jgi:hypothetical protein
MAEISHIQGKHGYIPVTIEDWQFINNMENIEITFVVDEINELLRSNLVHRSRKNRLPLNNYFNT